MATHVGELILGCWNNETGFIGPILGGFGAGEGAGGENILAVVMWQSHAQVYCIDWVLFWLS